ncbi:SUKH-4 family immunity protein [Micromonospora sp. RTGN7]|uniref:SUKH-4 family immunity protein n=1 Tax=Micromonospora sp. RTGN7 TaxID=3016526 RepID=UPI0029FEE1C2|nr:SUKH-4 family immunity protein [Micromonospora sp. RTGN7]
MLFEVDRALLMTQFPAEKIVRASREALAGIVERTEDLRFLCEVGLPQGLFQIAPPIAADQGAQPALLLDLGEDIETAELEFGELVLIGGIQQWYLFLHLGDGTVYSYSEDDAEFHPVNGDLSSLTRVLYLLRREAPRTVRLPGQPFTGPSNAEYTRAADAIRAEMETRDPISFGDRSLWLPYFGSFVDGLYPTYSTSLSES